MSKLDDIIEPKAYGFDKYEECPECMFNFKEAKQAIKALILELIDTTDSNHTSGKLMLDVDELKAKVQDL